MLQLPIFTLHISGKIYDFKTSAKKSKFIALKGKFQVRTKEISGI
jgi:hypothetical protein